MNLTERDKAHLWHPLTQHKLKPNHLPIVKAKGCTLYDDQGNDYIDGIASWYTCMYGHCNAYITTKIKVQLDKLDQVVFNGFTHQPAIELSEKLMAILPSNQNKLFFSDNGSTAVDVAIKMALQYFFNTNEKRTRIIALEDAFHGDTFGAMSVSGLSVYNGPFEPYLLTIDRVKVPTKDNFKTVFKAFRNLAATGEIAAFIYEPLVQGANAMRMYDAELLDGLLAISKTHNIITIADEVMTGFGKTAKNFASEYMLHQPDIICMSKALTAGIAPMALTSCTQKIYEAFCDDEISKGFFHGHTYSANPLACTAASAGIDLLLSDEIQARILEISARHLAFENRIKQHKNVNSTRCLGVIFALDLYVEMDRYGALRDKLYNYFMAEGVFLRPLGNTIYILPPYVISNTELERIYEVIETVLELI
ncbi:adenosylmethionine--8-amino-7-oxononanoate transaminase [Flavobacteriaceae bacterium]|nr:adenosylmethionine--8-amino-7-oxononanoate transaminase [Flavobacteriaceae bacterium]MDC1539492.1 adenosylmethionine--8-amino-7-oxononanoate transaminase [Flavobacteriaceae bacterium]